MNVEVNGSVRVLPEEATVASILELLDVAPGARGVAVAVDGEVVSRSAWPRTPLHDGCRIEVVAAIQGG